MKFVEAFFEAGHAAVSAQQWRDGNHPKRLPSIWGARDPETWKSRLRIALSVGEMSEEHGFDSNVQAMKRLLKSQYLSLPSKTV